MIVILRIGNEYTEVINAVDELNPVDLRIQFSDEPPIITLFTPATIRSPVKSIVLVMKYVILLANVITPLTAVGKSNLEKTNTNSFPAKPVDVGNNSTIVLP